MNPLQKGQTAVSLAESTCRVPPQFVHLALTSGILFFSLAPARFSRVFCNSITFFFIFCNILVKTAGGLSYKTSFPVFEFFCGKSIKTRRKFEIGLKTRIFCVMIKAACEEGRKWKDIREKDVMSGF